MGACASHKIKFKAVEDQIYSSSAWLASYVGENQAKSVARNAGQMRPAHESVRAVRILKTLFDKIWNPERNLAESANSAPFQFKATDPMWTPFGLNGFNRSFRGLYLSILFWFPTLRENWSVITCVSITKTLSGLYAVRSGFNFPFYVVYVFSFTTVYPFLSNARAT